MKEGNFQTLLKWGSSTRILTVCIANYPRLGAHHGLQGLETDEVTPEGRAEEEKGGGNPKKINKSKTDQMEESAISAISLPEQSKCQFLSNLGKLGVPAAKRRKACPTEKATCGTGMCVGGRKERGDQHPWHIPVTEHTTPILWEETKKETQSSSTIHAKATLVVGVTRKKTNEGIWNLTHVLGQVDLFRI